MMMAMVIDAGKKPKKGKILDCVPSTNNWKLVSTKSSPTMIVSFFLLVLLSDAGTSEYENLEGLFSLLIAGKMHYK